MAHIADAVYKVSVALLKSNPPMIYIHAIGGSRNPRLTRGELVRKGELDDPGTQCYEFQLLDSDPAPLMKQPIYPVHAECISECRAGVSGIRVCAGGGVQQLGNAGRDRPDADADEPASQPSDVVRRFESLPEDHSVGSYVWVQGDLNDQRNEITTAKGHSYSLLGNLPRKIGSRSVAASGTIVKTGSARHGGRTILAIDWICGIDSDGGRS